MLKGMGFCGWGGGRGGGYVSCGTVEDGDRGDSEPGKRVMIAYFRGFFIEDRY